MVEEHYHCDFCGAILSREQVTILTTGTTITGMCPYCRTVIIVGPPMDATS